MCILYAFHVTPLGHEGHAVQLALHVRVFPTEHVQQVTHVHKDLYSYYYIHGFEWISPLMTLSAVMIVIKWLEQLHVTTYNRPLTAPACTA